MTTPILDGLIVLERAGRLAGAAGASLLAELGATVIRVEDPSLPPPREPEAWRTRPLALAGKRSLPLPARLLNGLMQPVVRTGDSPDAFFDYLRYLWVADGERAWQAFGEPVYSTKEAWISFVTSRRFGNIG